MLNASFMAYEDGNRWYDDDHIHVQVMLILIMKSFVSVLIRSPAYFSLASCYINSTAI